MPNFGELSSDLSIPGSTLADGSVTSAKLASSVKTSALFGQASSTSVSISDATERTVTGASNVSVVGSFSQWTTPSLNLGGGLSPGGFVFVRVACEARISAASNTSQILLQTARPDPDQTGTVSYAGYLSNNIISTWEGFGTARITSASYWFNRQATVSGQSYAPVAAATFMPVILPPSGSMQMRVAVITGYNSTATTYVRNLTASMHYIP